MTTSERPAPAPTPTVDPATLLRGRDLLCFSHDWAGDPLSKTHLMRLLARDNRVLWVNSIGYRAPTASKADIGRAFRKVRAAMGPVREVEPNIFVLNPLAIPAYGWPALRELSRRLLVAQVRRAMRRLRFTRPINWVFNPAAGLVAGRLGEERIYYYCVDEYTAFTGVASGALAGIEADLLARADAVFVSSQALLDSKSPANPRTFLVRHGVDYEQFRAALDASTVVPPEVAGLPRPVLGYFGLIARDWVDVDLLAHLAGRFPDASIVLLGKSTMDLSRLEALPNVHILGRKPYADLPAYCKGFDVALIPFPVSEVTRNANPLKAREYLAAGLPVVSTAVPEVEVLGLCRIGADAGGFADQVAEALREPGPSAARSEAVRGQGWSARLDEVRAHLAAVGR